MKMKFFKKPDKKAYRIPVAKEPEYVSHDDVALIEARLRRSADGFADNRLHTVKPRSPKPTEGQVTKGTEGFGTIRPKKGLLPYSKRHKVPS